MADAPTSPRSGYTRVAAVATLATLASYAATLVQQVFYARVLGVNTETDALAVSLAWATGIAGIAGTTFISVMVPAYVVALRSHPDDARRLFRTATSLWLAFGLVATIATFLLEPQLARLLLPGSETDAMRTAQRLLGTAAPLVPLWIGIAAATALANARAQFGWAAASAIVPSLFVIGSLLLPAEPTGETTLHGYVAGAVVQLLILLVIVRPWIADVLPYPSRKAIRPLTDRLVPVAFAFILLTVATLSGRAIGSLGGPGDAAVVDYANRLVSAAEAALLSGVLAVLLTTWSIEASVSQTNEQRGSIEAVLVTSVGLLVAGAFALAILANELVGTLFGGGRFSSSDVEQVATFLRWMTPGVAVHAFMMLALRAQLAQGATWSVTSMAIVHIAIFVFMSLITHPLIGVNSVGLGYTLGWIGATLVTLAAVRAPKRMERLAMEAVRSLAASLVAAALTLALLSLMNVGMVMRLAVGTASFAISGLIFGSVFGVRYVGLLVARVTSSGRTF